MFYNMYSYIVYDRIKAVSFFMLFKQKYIQSQHVKRITDVSIHYLFFSFVCAYKKQNTFTENHLFLFEVLCKSAITNIIENNTFVRLKCEFDQIV